MGSTKRNGRNYQIEQKKWSEWTDVPMVNEEDADA